MPSLSIPSDSFSHGQIKSKLWLCESFALWFKKYLSADNSYILNWYGSWVGIGPFLLLANNPKLFKKINLYDLNSADLATSKNLLDFWRCESVEINTHTADVNSILPSSEPHQIFINTSCEHVHETQWLANIPKNTHILLQSTDMPHVEHTNCPTDMTDFAGKYAGHINILEQHFIQFNYPDKKFSRYMLFGTKK